MEEAQEFEWDSSNLRHLARHRISRQEFEEAMRGGPVVVAFSNDSGEERWSVLGMTRNLRVLYMVYAFREDRIRAITGWNAPKQLREHYYRTKAH